MTTTSTEKTAQSAPAKTAAPAHDWAAAARNVKAEPMPGRGGVNALDGLVEQYVEKGDQSIPGLPTEELAKDAVRMLRSAANRRDWGSSIKYKAQPDGTFKVHFSITRARKRTGANANKS